MLSPSAPPPAATRPGPDRQLGLVLMVWFALAGAQMTRPWLPAGPRQSEPALAAQIIGLRLFSVLLGSALKAALGSPRAQFSLYSIQVQATFTACGCLLLEFQQRSRSQIARGQHVQQHSLALERQLDAARIQLLQAQVEPHFLFNTLAHLRWLADTDLPQARSMLADLLRYLQTGLPGLRQEEATLAGEVELVCAFLNLHQCRLGEARLCIDNGVMPGLETARLPSGCLLTLAENAITQGVTPQVAEGSVTGLVSLPAWPKAHRCQPQNCRRWPFPRQGADAATGPCVV